MNIENVAREHAAQIMGDDETAYPCWSKALGAVLRGLDPGQREGFLASESEHRETYLRVILAEIRREIGNRKPPASKSGMLDQSRIYGDWAARSVAYVGGSHCTWAGVVREYETEFCFSIRSSNPEKHRAVYLHALAAGLDAAIKNRLTYEALSADCHGIRAAVLAAVDR